MQARDYSVEMLIQADPESVYEAITKDIEKWWTALSNPAVDLGDLLTVRFEGATSWKMAVSEAVPCKTLSWAVVAANHDLDDLVIKNEWIGTSINWGIEEAEAGCRVSFTHHGLRPELECFGICHAGWDYFLGSLKQYLETGKGYPYQPQGAL